MAMPPPTLWEELGRDGLVRAPPSESRLRSSPVVVPGDPDDAAAGLPDCLCYAEEVLPRLYRIDAEQDGAAAAPVSV